MPTEIKNEMHTISLKVNKQKYMWLRKALCILSEEINTPISVAAYLNKSLDNKIDEFMSLYSTNRSLPAEEDRASLSERALDTPLSIQKSAAWLRREFGVCSDPS